MTRRLRIGLAAATSLLLIPSTAGAAEAPLHPSFRGLPPGFHGIPGAVPNAKPAPAAPKLTAAASKAPVVLKVTPKNAKVGQLLTITGRNFTPGRGKNLVFFYGAKGGTWATADNASRTRMTVRVPAKLGALLPTNGKKARIWLRIKSAQLGARSATGVSPLISIAPASSGSGSGTGSGSGSGGGTVTAACTPNFNDPSSDVDHDLMPDVRERGLMLDPCNPDSDGDGVPDGYEYYSALDLNSSNLPYPAKMPYPNPLYKDAATDYDGDGLTLADEYALWKTFGSNSLPLDYSDGKQVSVPTAAPDPTGPLYYLDMNGDGVLSDDERDADGDGLSNWDEAHGRMTPGWWMSMYDGQNGPLETPYPVTFGGTDMLNADSDGDGVPDGADDQDHDGLTNAFEVARPANWIKSYIAIGWTTHNWDANAGTPRTDYGVPPRYYSRVQPFNPCKPVWSSVCNLHPPFGWYQATEDWMGATNPPAPGARPGDV
jgi:hypothetical protein